MRIALEQLERQAVRVGAEGVAVGARAQHEVEHALGPAARLERLEELRRVAAGHARAGRGELALDQRLDHQ